MILNPANHTLSTPVEKGCGREQYAEAAAAQAKIKELTSILSDTKRLENIEDRANMGRIAPRRRGGAARGKDFTWAITLLLLVGVGVLMFVRIAVYGEPCAIPEYVCLDGEGI